MKKSNQLKCLLLLLFIMVSSLVKAQQHRLPCGNGRIDTSADNAARAYGKLHKNILSTNYLVRVYFHIFADNNGGNPAATPAQVESEFTSLLNSYAGDNVCFIRIGVDYINNSTLNNNFNADTDPTGAALSPYYVAECINIFYMQAINGSNTACSPPCGYGGIALGGIPGTLFLVATGNIGGGNTIGHEMGHSLGLYHTFEKNYGFENINGSNSSSTGDKVTDTPADPYAYNNLPCFAVNSSGLYSGNCPDPNRQTNFNPPYTNLMAYWGFGNPAATAGQFGRVNLFLLTYQPLIDCTSPSTVVLPTTNITTGIFNRTAITTLSTGGNSVLIKGTASSVLGASEVILSPGFQALPTSGFTQIIPRPCD